MRIVKELEVLHRLIVKTSTYSFMSGFMHSIEKNTFTIKNNEIVLT